MFKFAAGLILTITSISLSAQNVDELTKELAATKNDTTRIRISIAIANQLFNKNSDSTLFYSNNALSLTNKLLKKTKLSEKEQRDITFKKTLALSSIGAYYNKKYENDSSLFYYSNAVHFLEDLINTENDSTLKKRYQNKLAQDMITLGTVHFSANNSSMAAKLYRQAINLSTSIKDSFLVSKGLLNLGMILNNQGKFDEAIHNYFTAERIFERFKDKKGIAICRLSIGNIYRRQNSYEKAIENYNNALNLFKEINDKRGECACYNNLGISYAYIDDYNKSLKFYNKALEIYQEQGNERDVAMVYTNISTLFQYQGEYGKAIEYISKSLEINKKRRDANNIMGAYLNMASTNFARAENDTTINDFQRRTFIRDAIENAHNGLKLADSLQLIMGQISAVKMLKDIYSFNGNYKQAYEMANNVIVLNDSLFNKEKAEAITDVETKYDTEKKENRIHQQEMKLQRQKLELDNARLLRNSLTIVIILMLLLIILISRNYRQKYKAHQKLDEKNKLINIKNKEILHKSNELQSANKKLTELLHFKERMTGMIVHDLKNPLNNILNSNTIPDEDFREQLIIQSGYDMLNLVENILDVYKLQETGLKIHKEEVNINTILDTNILEVALYLNEKGIKISYPPKKFPVIFADKKIIKRIFSNLLSNAVKFSPLNSVIKIHFEISGINDIQISVHNHGPVIPKEKQSYIFENFGQAELRNIGITASTGLGLSFCKIAVETHGGEIGVISEKEETEFWFTLPGALKQDT